MERRTEPGMNLGARLKYISNFKHLAAVNILRRALKNKIIVNHQAAASSVNAWHHACAAAIIHK